MADARLHVVLLAVGPQAGAEIVRGHGLADGADVVALALDGEQRRAADRLGIDATAVPVKPAEAAPAKAADAAPAKAEGGEKDAGSSSSYHRGEGQKPVSKAYKDNWNVIFGKKKKR